MIYDHLYRISAWLLIKIYNYDHMRVLWIIWCYNILNFHFVACLSALMACSCLLLMAQTLATLRATVFLFLCTVYIVNGYQLLCDDHTMLESQGELQLYFYCTHYRPFPLFLFMCLWLWQSYFFQNFKITTCTLFDSVRWPVVRNAWFWSQTKS